MIERKKRLRFIQLILLISAIIITYLVYYDKGIDSNNEIISKSKKIIQIYFLILNIPA